MARPPEQEGLGSVAGRDGTSIPRGRAWFAAPCRRPRAAGAAASDRERGRSPRAMLTIQSSPWLGIDVLRRSLQIRDMAASTRPRESSLRDFHGRLGRARDVLRQEGVRVLSIKILGETLYRRLLIMELPLDRELSTIGA